MPRQFDQKASDESIYDAFLAGEIDEDAVRDSVSAPIQSEVFPDYELPTTSADALPSSGPVNFPETAEEEHARVSKWLRENYPRP